MKMAKVTMLFAAIALAVGSLGFASNAQAQVRTEKRPDVLLVVGGVAAAALLVLLVAGGGGDGNERPTSP